MRGMRDESRGRDSTIESVGVQNISSSSPGGGQTTFVGHMVGVVNGALNAVSCHGQSPSIVAAEEDLGEQSRKPIRSNGGSSRQFATQRGEIDSRDLNAANNCYFFSGLSISWLMGLDHGRFFQGGSAMSIIHTKARSMSPNRIRRIISFSSSY
ncbi:hypothetical protein BGZ63DRAFT_398270 [Mariannaea sp. PMI_226]|nr:hypothetical protein BGZ63DRAFT_398270 [Mariannaea sp. PMI_226]